MKHKWLGVVSCILLFASLAAAQADKSGGSAEQTLKDMEARWSAAVLKSDAAPIGDILAEDFVSVSTEGKVHTRADIMNEAKKSKMTRSANSDVRVRMLGVDVALVTGIWDGAGSDPTGKKFETLERWTDVFVRKDGKWKCVASQGTEVRDPKDSLGILKK